MKKPLGYRFIEVMTIGRAMFSAIYIVLVLISLNVETKASGFWGTLRSNIIEKGTAGSSETVALQIYVMTLVFLTLPLLLSIPAMIKRRGGILISFTVIQLLIAFLHPSMSIVVLILQLVLLMAHTPTREYMNLSK